MESTLSRFPELNINENSSTEEQALPLPDTLPELLKRQANPHLLLTLMPYLKEFLYEMLMSAGPIVTGAFVEYLLDDSFWGEQANRISDYGSDLYEAGGIIEYASLMLSQQLPKKLASKVTGYSFFIFNLAQIKQFRKDIIQSASPLSGTHPVILTDPLLASYLEVQFEFPYRLHLHFKEKWLGDRKHLPPHLQPIMKLHRTATHYGIYDLTLYLGNKKSGQLAAMLLVSKEGEKLPVIELAGDFGFSADHVWLEEALRKRKLSHHSELGSFYYQLKTLWFGEETRQVVNPLCPKMLNLLRKTLITWAKVRRNEVLPLPPQIKPYSTDSLDLYETIRPDNQKLIDQQMQSEFSPSPIETFTGAPFAFDFDLHYDRSLPVFPVTTVKGHPVVQGGMFISRIDDVFLDHFLTGYETFYWSPGNRASGKDLSELDQARYRASLGWQWLPMGGLPESLNSLLLRYATLHATRSIMDMTDQFLSERRENRKHSAASEPEHDPDKDRMPVKPFKRKDHQTPPNTPLSSNPTVKKAPGSSESSNDDPPSGHRGSKDDSSHSESDHSATNQYSNQQTASHSGGSGSGDKRDPDKRPPRDKSLNPPERSDSESDSEDEQPDGSSQPDSAINRKKSLPGQNKAARLRRETSNQVKKKQQDKEEHLQKFGRGYGKTVFAPTAREYQRNYLDGQERKTTLEAEQTSERRRKSNRAEIEAKDKRDRQKKTEFQQSDFSPKFRKVAMTGTHAQRVLTSHPLETHSSLPDLTARSPLRGSTHSLDHPLSIRKPELSASTATATKRDQVNAEKLEKEMRLLRETRPDPEQQRRHSLSSLDSSEEEPTDSRAETIRFQKAQASLHSKVLSNEAKFEKHEKRLGQHSSRMRSTDEFVDELDDEVKKLKASEKKADVRLKNTEQTVSDTLDLVMDNQQMIDDQGKELEQMAISVQKGFDEMSSMHSADRKQHKQETHRKISALESASSATTDRVDQVENRQIVIESRLDHHLFKLRDNQRDAAEIINNLRLSGVEVTHQRERTLALENALEESERRWRLQAKINRALLGELRYQTRVTRVGNTLVIAIVAAVAGGTIYKLYEWSEWVDEVIKDDHRRNPPMVL